MAILEHGADGSLCFATRADDEKRDEILQVPDVAVTMQGGGHYLSLSGRAKLVTTTRPAPDLPLSVRPWFPEGIDDPRFVLIVVDPDYAEFWDRSDRLRLPPNRQLDRCLAELQDALGDSAAEPRYVRKVGDAGFQLLATIHVDVPPVPTSDQILYLRSTRHLVRS